MSVHAVFEIVSVLVKAGSSVRPSQSLSAPSQAAPVGAPGVTLQVVAVCAVSQTYVPERAQTPRPTLQAAPLFAKSSSTELSQSLSSPSHFSADGFTLRTQVGVPA